MDAREDEWDDRDWDRLVDQIRNGDCTPFLGSGACVPTLPSGGKLARSLAAHYGFPFDHGAPLHEVTQYASIVEGDPVTVKQRVARELRDCGHPNYAGPAQPHALLAQYPIKVYLTTNYDDFMASALRLARKRPVVASCPWYAGAENDPQTSIRPEYQPRDDEPLVYHLHGSLDYPPSLVLAEQDYIEFLVSLAQDLGQDTRRLVPVQILPALTRQPLLFIGYSLHDWSFRVLFHGFVKPVAEGQRRRHVSVQLAPDLEAIPDDTARHQAEQYLTRYFAKLNISVYWGSAEDFCSELASRLARPA